MANLPDETLATASMLLLRLFQVINLATATEFNLFEQYGETQETFGELEELKNVAERARVLYNRIYGLMLQVAESQPVANLATMRLLYQSIELAEPTADSGEGSVQEIKKELELTMNNEKRIPDAETRARNVARLREVNQMLDEVNKKLELAQAIAELDLQNSPLYVRRRERAKKQLEALAEKMLAEKVGE